MGSTTAARASGGLTGRQVNLLLESLLVTAIASGLASWAVDDRWSRWLVLAHGAAGLAVVLLVPAKVRGPVSTGFRRGRATRWVSTAFGVLVLATVALGVLHATGLWFGVGYWSALWTHSLFGFALVPLLAWHVASRPVRPRPADLDRRAVLRGGLVLGGALALTVVQDRTARLAGLAGADRRGTGSHEVASHRPEDMPTVVWLDDERPDDLDPATWRLEVEGEPVDVGSLWDRARPIVATLDCTGGWWSEQAWDGVPLTDLLGPPRGRSIRVESATGYARLFAHEEVDGLHLAVGYGGEPLRGGHGAPVRLVVPGRRGPEWVKWVTAVRYDDRPSWLQAPLPLT